MNILTFDIEEWFHILDNDSTKTENDWNKYEVRIHINFDHILSILKNTGCNATFFCMGWIAKKFPEVVKKIAALGYEIGSHSYMHQLIYEQDPKSFARDLEYSIKVLEDLTGKNVKYFRAPGFSIFEKNKWAIEVLYSQGIEIDCSVFPANRAHGGFPTYKEPVPSIIKYNNIQLKELPINYVKLLNKPIIFSGGGYFRLFPYFLIRHWTKQSNYVMTYFHPRDFDPDQPMIKNLPLTRKFKSYVGLKGASAKLEKWLTDFEFMDVFTAAESIDWRNVPVVEL